MMPSSTPAAVDRPRAAVWLTPNHTRLGARAVVAAATHPRPRDNSSIERRPRRSARADTTSEATTPMRTAASVAPWAVSLEPNSSATKVMVWLRRVPR